jgi:hypothetical protein
MEEYWKRKLIRLKKIKDPTVEVIMEIQLAEHYLLTKGIL